MFLKLWKNLRENTSTRVSFLIKVAGLRPPTLIKKRLWHRCFPVNFSVLLRQLVGFRYGKKSFYQNSGRFGYSLIANDIMFMYLLCNYKKPIILNLFKIDKLHFTTYILAILTYPLKTYVIRLHNLISVNIFYTIKDHSFSS